MKKILIIDDSDTIREELKLLLSLEDYQVFEAEDGMTGVELALTKLPDLIISDIIMPDMDGYEELAALKDHPETSHIPFIFLTAMNSITSHILGQGAEDYFTKPFDSEKLLERVRNLINDKSETESPVIINYEAAPEKKNTIHHVIK